MANEKDDIKKCVCATCGFVWYEDSSSNECDYCKEEREEREDEEAIADKEWLDLEMLDFD